jgi:hypothetical protein
MQIGSINFREVIGVDFEYVARRGEPPDPICMVARSFVTGTTYSLWRDELLRRTEPPYPIDDDTLVVGYYASAEIGCHLRLGWPVPTHLLDLFTEFRNFTNGRDVPCGNGLLGALAFFGLDSITVTEKDAMRELALREGPLAPAEREALLAYCQSDVDALARLLRKLLTSINGPLALLRGRYMVAAARIEATGIPIDVETHQNLVEYWEAIKNALVDRIDTGYGVYENGVFKRDRFAAFLVTKEIPWPRLPSGQLSLDDRTFRDMARAHPLIAPLQELRVSRSQLRLADVAVGSDARNRCLLSAFRARTGRNQPTNSGFIFGPAVWLRGLIKPSPGRALAYIDWSQQEFGIAAALSSDAAMLDAYQSSDPYLTFAKQAGATPPTATRQTHAVVRDLFKQCVLAVQYGMEAESFAQRIGQSPAKARELLMLHRNIYRRFWAWSDAVVDHAFLHGNLYTTFGWQLHVGPSANPRSLRNFPMQANGAEMLRLACCLATEEGIAVCAPIHDAILIEAPIDDIDHAVVRAQCAMAEASRVVLGGLELRSEATVIRYPERYADARGGKMWETVQELLAEQLLADVSTGAAAPAHPGSPGPSLLCLLEGQ